MSSTSSMNASSQDLPDIFSQQAVEFSGDWISAYESAHQFQISSCRMAIAEARLEFLLMEARGQLSGNFSSFDFHHLLHCFTGEILAPADIDEMANAVREYDPAAAELARKLESLTWLQKVGLADLLEQMYHRGSEKGHNPLCIAQELGVALQ